MAEPLNGIITSWNNAAQQMFGYTADEIVGQWITILFPPDRLTEEELIERIKRGERVDHFRDYSLSQGWKYSFPYRSLFPPLSGRADT